MRDERLAAIRSTILEQSPFNRSRPTVEHPKPEDIAAALAEVRRKGISDRESARIAAYAWYNGVESDSVLALFRSRGVTRIIKDELSSLQKTTLKITIPHNSFAFRHFSELELAKELGLPELGWTVAILSAAAEADFDAVLECLDMKSDPNRIVSFFLVARPFLPPPRWQRTIQKFLALGDELSREVVIELLSRWIEITVSQGGVERVITILDDLEVDQTLGPVILGALLESTQRFQRGRFSQEITDRVASLQDAIEAAGKKLVVDRKTVNAILKHAGIRDLNVLAAMSQWRQDPTFTQAASRALSNKATEVLEKRFRTRLEMNEDQAALELAPSGPWSIEPLVQVLAHDGISPDLFNSYFDTLATDQLSKMTRYRTFLEDRQRAILLVSVGALVANARGDQPLLAAAQNAADRLRLQPAGVVEVIKSAGRDELRKLGVDIPEK
jgi:hypothetical protein